jgi:hypothetical protein
MADGVLLGALVFALGMAAGAVAMFWHDRSVMVEQAHCIEALEDYIAEHSDGEASAADLGL